MKYVMFKRELPNLTHYVPVIFPNTGVHSDIAAAIISMPGMSEFKPVSAGEVTLGFEINCSGHSTTLELASDPEHDQYVIAMNDYGGAFE